MKTSINTFPEIIAFCFSFFTSQNQRMIADFDVALMGKDGLSIIAVILMCIRGMLEMDILWRFYSVCHLTGDDNVSTAKQFECPTH